MKRRKGRPTADVWETRSGELAPIFNELMSLALNDSAAAEMLTARGIRALGGGNHWQRLQVERIRERLNLAFDKAISSYKDLLKCLQHDLGRRLTRHDYDYKLIDHTACLIVHLGWFTGFVEREGVEDLTLAQCERYETLVQQLCLT